MSGRRKKTIQLDYSIVSDFSDWVLEQLYIAYHEAARHKRGTADEVKFEMNLHENMALLHYDIMHETYKTSPGIAFVVTDPVIREVFAAPFRDRIVHHFLLNIVAPWWDRRFIYDSYSCRLGKGTLFGIMRLKDFIRKASRNYTRKVYVAKFDLQGYFMSLPRKGLYQKMAWGLERQFPHGGPVRDTAKFLWRQVLFDDPIKGVKRRGDLSLWQKLPKNKSLFNQPPGKGIVIGNLTSQLVSNVYLDEFDRFMKYDLGYKYYGRYVDDFFVVVTEEEFEGLKKEVRIIEAKLASMGLTLHPKKRHMQEAGKGTPFLGTVIYPGHVVPSARVRNNFYRALERIVRGDGDFESIISYVGLVQHYNSKKIMAKIFDKLGQDFNWDFY